MRDLYLNKRGAEMLLNVTKYRGTAPDVARIKREAGQTVYCLTWVWSSPEAYLMDMLKEEDEDAILWNCKPFTNKYWLMKANTLDMIFKWMHAAEIAKELGVKAVKAVRTFAELVAFFGYASVEMAKIDVARICGMACKGAKRVKDISKTIARATVKLAKAEAAWVHMQVEEAAHVVAENLELGMNFIGAVGKVTKTAAQWTADYMVTEATHNAKREYAKMKDKAVISIRRAKEWAAAQVEKAKVLVPALIARAKGATMDASKKAISNLACMADNAKPKMAALAKAAWKNVLAVMEMNMRY